MSPWRPVITESQSRRNVSSYSYTDSPRTLPNESDIRTMLQCISAKGRPDYELWCRVSAATLHAVRDDREHAIKLLQEFFPEGDSVGDYEKLFKTEWTQITTGTLVHLAREHGYRGTQREQHSYPAPPPIAVSFFKVIENPPPVEDTLLGDRWLCRGGAALMIGPSGIGKSSASMQQDLCWAAGREAFGIHPARPLKILIIQAENDQGDLYEMGRGVMEGLSFSKEEQANIAENLHIVFEQARTGPRFVFEVIEPLLEKHRPDIIRIDPLAAYAGADMTQADKSAEFLRSSLNPLLTKYRCGLILVHHTPKTNNRDTSNYRSTDWMYAGAGSADIVNWARGALIIDPSHTQGLFRFIAAKRGGRIGWRDSDDKKAYEKWFKHSEATFYCWEETSAPAATGKPPKHTVDDVWIDVPTFPQRILKNTLISKLGKRGIGENSARRYVNQLLEEEHLIPSEEPRSGTNPAKYVQRAEHVVADYRNEDGNIVHVLRPSTSGEE